MSAIHGSGRKFYAALLADLSKAAEERFFLEIPGKDGRTRRSIFEGLAERSRQHRAELDVSPIPEGGERLFEWFADIAQGRGSNGFGPSYLPAAEILAWAQLTHTRLSPWEFRAVRALDRAWMKAWNELNQSDD